MVAAWISALTGVGPSMASGNQVYRGSWADFPVAPMKRRRVIRVTIPLPTANFSGAAAKTALKSMVPKVTKIRKMASRKP